LIFRFFGFDVLLKFQNAVHNGGFFRSGNRQENVILMMKEFGDVQLRAKLFELPPIYLLLVFQRRKFFSKLDAFFTNDDSVDVLAVLVFDFTGKDVRDVGFEKANIITMLKYGSTRIPLSRIPALAKSIGVNPGMLMRMALNEYQPEVLKAIEECLGPIQTKD
jgi:hypothetical protein